MNKEDKEAVLDSLSTSLDKLMVEKGFKKIKKNWWQRKYAWKTDEIMLLCKHLSSIYILFTVKMPAKNESDTPIIFAETNVGKLAGIEMQYFKFPILKMFSARFVDSTINQVMLNMNWFDEYTTPAKCLTLLKNGKSGIHNQKSPAYKEAYEHLTKLVDLIPSIRCLPT